MLLNFEQTDKGLDGQIAVNVASSSVVCQLLCIVALNDLSVSEKELMMGRMFFFNMWCPLRQQVAAGVDKDFLDVLNDKMVWMCASQQNACQAVKFFLKDVVFGYDHVVSEHL